MPSARSVASCAMRPSARIAPPAGRQRQIRRQIVVAGADLGRHRLVVRRQALHRVRDPAGDEREAVVAPGRDRLRREAVGMQRRVQQDPGVIAGERPAAGVGAVHPRREPDDHERGVVGAERRHRPAEVARIRLAHAIEERREPCAAAAIGIVRRRRRRILAECRRASRGGSLSRRASAAPASPAALTLPKPDRPPMLPAEPKLEVRSCLPARANGNGRKPPLLFVHGGLLRRVVLGAAFPALVRGQGLRGARAVAARPWRVRRPRRRCS